MPVTFRPVDLPFLATVVGGSAPNQPLEDWESYTVGTTGTQTLNAGFGFAGSWSAVPNYFGINGEENWDYVSSANAGTIALDGGFGYGGSWSLLPGGIEIIGTETWDYVLSSYGSGGATSSSALNSGFGFTGTWFAGANRVQALSGYDDWETYSVGDAGTQVLSAGSGFSDPWTS